MGMPLSRFTQLYYAVGNNGERGCDLLSSFKVYCVVLHKHHRDFEFVNKLKRNFEWLNSATGKDMLFMTYFCPPRGWNSESDYWKGSKNRLMCDRVVNENQVYDCLWSLIPNDMDETPVVMVSTDLTSGNVVLMKTDSFKIDTQLIEIGKFASSLNSFIDISANEAFRRFLSGIGECCDFELPDSLLRILLDIEAANAIVVNNYDVGQQDIKNLVKRGMLGKQKRMEALEGDVSENREEWGRASLEYSSYRKLVTLNVSSKRREIRPSRFNDSSGNLFMLRQPMHYLGFMQMNVSDDFSGEPEDIDMSKFSLMTKGYNMQGFEFANRIAVRHYNKEIEMMKGPDESDLEDYGIYGDGVRYYKSASMDLYLILSLEMEMSVEQAVREMYGIEMPAFFNRYCDNAECIISNGKKPIDFNMLFDDKWKAPSLGDAMYAIDGLRKRKELSGYLADNFMFPLKDIIKQALVINDCRNRGAGHSGNVEFNDFEKMHTAFKTFWDEYFNYMFILKRKLMG